ncbi:MAG: hypothetical protein V1791_13195 [Pseudomonadota bacterium]
MKTMISKSQQEVWAMKDAAYEETKQMSGAEYFRYIREQVKKDSPNGLNPVDIESLPNAASSAPESAVS